MVKFAHAKNSRNGSENEIIFVVATTVRITLHKIPTTLESASHATAIFLLHTLHHSQNAS